MYFKNSKHEQNCWNDHFEPYKANLFNFKILHYFNQNVLMGINIMCHTRAVIPTQLVYLKYGAFSLFLTHYLLEKRY